VPVPKEYLALLSRWCADRVPAHVRSRLQVAYKIHGEQVTITERRPPAYPELNSAWSIARIAQLRHNEPEKGLWRLYRPTDGGWTRYDHAPSTMPEPLLAEVARDPHSVFWG
jgi:hypothetical protein